MYGQCVNEIVVTSALWFESRLDITFPLEIHNILLAQHENFPLAYSEPHIDVLSLMYPSKVLSNEMQRKIWDFTALLMKIQGFMKEDAMPIHIWIQTFRRILLFPSSGCNWPNKLILDCVGPEFRSSQNPRNVRNIYQSTWRHSSEDLNIHYPNEYSRGEKAVF